MVVPDGVVREVLVEAGYSDASLSNASSACSSPERFSDTHATTGLMDSSNPNLNPYAPPQTESFAEVPAPSLETLKQIGPIPYAGGPDERALDEFLYAYGHVDWGYLLVVGFVLTFVLLSVSLFMGGFLLAFGGIGLVIIVLTVSTTSYRRLVFENINPRWNQPNHGALTAEGVRIDRKQSSAFFRWDWYGGAVISDQVVALLPATQPAQPLLITQAMLLKLDDWSRLLEVASAIGLVSDEAPIDNQHRQKNLRLLRRANRARSIAPPPGAIAFEGALDADDFQRLPDRFRWRERPLRSYAVIAGLFFFGSFVVIAISQSVFQQLAFLPAFILIYAVLAGIGFAFRKLRRRNVRSNAIYYLVAFATDTSLVIDFLITTTKVDWSALRLVSRTKDRIVLQRREWIQFIVARRDMFSSEEDWQRFNELVD
jgi:hypothetical protein